MSNESADSRKPLMLPESCSLHPRKNRLHALSPLPKPYKLTTLNPTPQPVEPRNLIRSPQATLLSLHGAPFASSASAAAWASTSRFRSLAFSVEGARLLLGSC